MIMTGRCTRMVLLSQRQQELQQQRRHHSILHRPFRKHRCSSNVALIIGRYLVTSSSRPRRRRPKALTSSSINNNNTATKPMTTRDRIRQVIELNKVPSKGQDPGKTVDRMLSVATERLTWLQDRVYRHWNPDHRPISIGAGQTNTDGTATTTAATVRKRTQVVMDRRWWFWNIAFALLPAAVITLYCELRVRPAMRAHHARQNETHQRRDQSKGNASTNTMKLDNIVEESVQEQQTKTLTERLAALWTEAQALVVDNMTGEKEKKDASSENVKKESPKGSSTQGAASTNSPTTVQGPSAGDSSKSSSSTTSTTSIEPFNLETLAQRLDRLERLIENNAVRDQHSDDGVVDEETLPNKGQSGMRNRIERRIRESAREASARDAEKEKDETSILNDWGKYMWHSMASLLNNGNEGRDKEPNRDEAVDQKIPLPRKNNDQGTENKENDSKPSSSRKGENHGTNNAPSLEDDHMDGKPEKPWWKMW